jgi:hypothetical protein
MPVDKVIVNYRAKVEELGSDMITKCDLTLVVKIRDSSRI